MTAKQAVQLVIKEIEEQDPTGSKDTLVLSPLLAAKLLQSYELEVDRSVMDQEGFPALQKVGVMGYDVKVNAQLRGFQLDVVTLAE